MVLRPSVGRVFVFVLSVVDFCPVVFLAVLGLQIDRPAGRELAMVGVQFICLEEQTAKHWRNIDSLSIREMDDRRRHFGSLGHIN